MFIIRKEQMQVFEDSTFRQFVDDTVIHLQTHYPKQTEEMSEPDLRKMVEVGTERAETYGIVTVTDVQRFLGCMLEIGQNFDVEPQTDWAGEILRREDASGTLKMDEIEEQMNFRLVEKV